VGPEFRFTSGSKGRDVFEAIDLIAATAQAWGIFCGALPVLGRW